MRMPPGRELGSRATSRLMVPGSWPVWSSGTETFAHWNPWGRPHEDQSTPWALAGEARTAPSMVPARRTTTARTKAGTITRVGSCARSDAGLPASAATADPGGVRLVACSVAALLALAAPAFASPTNGGTAPVDSASSGGSTPAKHSKRGVQASAAPAAAPASGAVAQIVDGLARSPAGSPAAVRSVLRAGNKLQDFPYRYGGGHEDFV